MQKGCHNIYYHSRWLREIPRLAWFTVEVTTIQTNCLHPCHASQRTLSRYQSMLSTLCNWSMSVTGRVRLSCTRWLGAPFSRARPWQLGTSFNTARAGTHSPPTTHCMDMRSVVVMTNCDRKYWCKLWPCVRPTVDLVCLTDHNLLAIGRYKVAQNRSINC